MTGATTTMAMAVGLLLAMAASSQGLKTWNLTVQPNFKPPVGNILLCTAVRVPDNETWTLVHLEYRDARPSSIPATALCPEPGFTDREVWDCGEDSGMNLLPKAGLCADNIDHNGIATGVSGPRLQLPPGVGFRVGGDSGMRAIVLATHYPHTEREYVDNMTYVLTLAQAEEGEQEPSPAHTLTFHTFTRLPPHSLSSVESFYEVKEDVHLLPLAFVGHTHGLSSRSRVWVVSPAGEWTRMKELVKRGTGQRFIDLTVTSLPVEHPERVIVQGDRIVAQCVLPNASNRSLLVRATGDKQEMCNIEFSYYSTTGDRLAVDMVLNDDVQDGEHAFDWSDDPVLRPQHQALRPLTQAEEQQLLTGVGL